METIAKLDQLTNKVLLARTEHQYKALLEVAVLFENSDKEFYELCKIKALNCLTYIDFLKNELCK